MRNNWLFYELSVFSCFCLLYVCQCLELLEAFGKGYPAGLNECSWATLRLQGQSFTECHLPFF